MEPQAQIAALALFYFYAFPDEKVALYATQKTWDRMRALFRRPQKKFEDWSQHFVLLTADGYNRYQRQAVKHIHLVPELQKEILHVHSADMGPWKEFRKRAGQDELLAVLWTQVLGLAEEDVTRALRISSGTLNHRLARGLRKLGEMSLGVGL